MEEHQKGTECQGSGISGNRSECPVCHGTGFELTVDPSAEFYLFARPCRACNGLRIRSAKEKRERADVPEERVFNDFDWLIYGTDLNREKRITEQFIKNFPAFEAEGMGLFIHSRTRGSGKTFLASCIAGELIDKYNATAEFVNASDIIDMSQRKTDSGSDPLERWKGARLLIIDDLGQKLTGRDWLEDILFKVIDFRYRNKKVTIITSNETLSQLNFDDRILDRVNSMTILVSLPEFCVRAREANSRKREILRRLGID